VALLPYRGWNAFALALNTRIAILNRDGHGR
jgi:tryptophan-rich sensory protein